MLSSQRKIINTSSDYKDKTPYSNKKKHFSSNQTPLTHHQLNHLKINKNIVLGEHNLIPEEEGSHASTQVITSEYYFPNK